MGLVGEMELRFQTVKGSVSVPYPTNWLMTQGPRPCPGLHCNGRGLEHSGSRSSENTCLAPWE